MKLNYILSLLIICSLLSCKEAKVNHKKVGVTKTFSSDLSVDHLNIWVKNPQLTKKRLTDLGFTSIPDSLSKIHKGQGTTGRYFNFLNAYLELIFIYDQQEFDTNNKVNNQLDFYERASFENNGASPFSIALKIKDYNVDKIPFETIKYHQEWMEENESIFAAKSSKKNLKEPSIFVVYPQIESDVFERMEDLKNIPDEYAIWRTFFKHPNGAKKITKMTIISSDLDQKSETIHAVNEIKNLSIKKGQEHLMEITFDENIQGKSFDLRPELPLLINL